MWKKKDGKEDPPAGSGGGGVICQRWIFVSAMCLCWRWRWRFEPRVSAHVCGVNTLLLILLLLFFFPPPPSSSSPSLLAAAFFFKSPQSQHIKTGSQAVSRWVGLAGWLPSLSVSRTLAHTIRSDPHTAR